MGFSPSPPVSRATSEEYGFNPDGSWAVADLWVTAFSVPQQPSSSLGNAQGFLMCL